MLRKVRFGVYEVDLDAMELRKYGAPVRLQEQPSRVLVSLVARPGEIVTRQELKELIWPKDTFVDFDHSLNKAVNRLRDALHDDAGQPRYIETVPRRGYRFIAPVANAASEVPPPSPQNISRSARFRWIALIGAAAILVVCVAAFLLLRKSRRPIQFAPTRMTRDGTSMFAELSRDGKLLAYCSSAGGNVAHIWVRQTAGGEAIQVTTGDSGDSAPSFSPDGTRIAYCSQRDGGGIYVVPSFGGEPRLVVKGGLSPRFSPDGERLLYSDEHSSQPLLVSLTGGQRSTLERETLMTAPVSALTLPIWSPSGKDILYYGAYGTRQRSQQPGWLVAPLAGTGSIQLNFQDSDGQTPGSAPIAHAWTQTQDGRQWIVYSASTGDSRSLFRVAVSADGQMASKPERLTSGTGLIPNASLSVDGKLAFTSADVSERIYVIPTAIEGENSPREPLHLAGTEAIRNLSPSMSRDGRWMAYGTTEESNNQTKIRLKDLVSGNDRVIAEKSDLFDRDFLSLSPDGSKVIFARLDMPSEQGVKSGVLSSYLVSANGGSQQKICELCLPRGFSSDGSLLLFQEPATNKDKLDHIISINLVSGTKRLFLSDADKALYHAFFSWDDHWVVFKKLLRSGHGQLLIAPVRNWRAGRQK